MLRALMFGIVCAISLTHSDSHAQFVRYTFTGSVKSVFDGPFFGADPLIGDPVAGSIQFEMAVTDSYLDPHIGYYRQSLPASLEVGLGGVLFSTDGDFLVGIQDGFAGFDSFEAYGGQMVAGVGPTMLVDGTPEIGTIQLQLRDDTAALWDSDALPAALNYPDFTVGEGSVWASTDTGLEGIGFSIDSFTLVPEPSCGMLLMLGALIVRSRRRIR